LIFITGKAPHSFFTKFTLATSQNYKNNMASCLMLLLKTVDVALYKQQWIFYLASGSSKESRFSHKVEIMLSYLFGYFLNISYKHKTNKL